MKYTGILFIFLFSLSLNAQQAERDVLQDIYQDVLHPSDALLHGREYKVYFDPMHSKVLIPENPNPTASVLIRNKMYQNVILQYDTYKDLLVYQNLNIRINNLITPVIINRNIIEEFTLQLPSGPARFRYLSFPEDQEGLLSSAFYEIVTEGVCQFIIDHSAFRKVEEGRVAYKYKTERYIINAGVITRIRGKKSLLKALTDEAAEVSAYLKRSNILVKRADKEQIKDVVDHYLTLKHL